MNRNKNFTTKLHFIRISIRIHSHGAKSDLYMPENFIFPRAKQFFSKKFPVIFLFSIKSNWEICANFSFSFFFFLPPDFFVTKYITHSTLSYFPLIKEVQKKIIEQEGQEFYTLKTLSALNNTDNLKLSNLQESFRRKGNFQKRRKENLKCERREKSKWRHERNKQERGWENFNPPPVEISPVSCTTKCLSSSSCQATGMTIHVHGMRKKEKEREREREAMVASGHGIARFPGCSSYKRFVPALNPRG